MTIDNPTKAQIESLANQLKEDPKLLELLISDKYKASWLIGLLNSIFILKALRFEFWKEGFSEKRMKDSLVNVLPNDFKLWPDIIKWLKRGDENE